MHPLNHSTREPNQQHLNLIKRFLQSDQALMLIVGEKGSGKTRLLLDIVLQMREARPIIRLQGNPKLNPSQLTQVLAKHWSIRHIDKNKRAENQLIDMLNGLKQKNQGYILSIDDAHLLSLPMLAALTHLIIQQQEKKPVHLHILLSGRPILAEKINNLITHEVPQLTMGALSREEAFQKIKRLFDKAGLSLPYAVTNALFATLYRRSGGMPATLESMTKKLMAQRPNVEPPTAAPIDQASASTPIKTPHPTHTQSTHWVKILSLTGLVTLSYFFWGWQHDAFSTKPKKIAWAPPTIEYTHHDLTSSKTPTLPTPAPNPLMAPALITTPPAPYTLQLMSGMNITALKQVIQKYPIAHQAAVMKTQYQHHDWYVLTFGHYTQAQQARAAIATLPADLQARHPWVRSTKKLHTL